MKATQKEPPPPLLLRNQPVSALPATPHNRPTTNINVASVAVFTTAVRSVKKKIGTSLGE